MKDYVEVKEIEDDVIKLVHRDPDTYQLVLNSDVIVKAKDVFKYDSNLTIKMLDDKVVVVFMPDTEEKTTYICLVDDIRKDTEKVSFELHNVASTDILLKKGMILGSFITMIQASHTENRDDNIYYKSDFLEVKEIDKGVINKFTYVIDEKGFHKLVFLLNRKLYEGNVNTELDLG